MEYFTEQARTKTEAAAKVRDKYGDGARILTHRAVRVGGVLGLFTREAVEVTGYVPPEGVRLPSQRRGSDEEEQRKILSSVGNEQLLRQLVKEVQGLKEQVAAGATAPARAEPPDGSHPAVARLEALFSKNDFSPRLAREILDRLRREFSLEELDEEERVDAAVLGWIGERVGVMPQPPRQQGGPRIIVLVGPTGVGKTTTIAKLAAYYGIGISGAKPLAVRMITIDNYRIGAKQQIETYGEIMGIPVSSVETYEDLRKTIDFYRKDVDVILVDTIGKSPNDYVKLAEMREMLQAAGAGSETHLAVSATTKASDLDEIMSQFEPFKYQAVVVTKLDETVRAGNVISALAARGKPASYYTDGQRVPQDIQAAGILPLLTRLEGFNVDRTALARRFGEER